MKACSVHGFIGLQRKFKIIDDDNSKTLSLSEFKKSMKEMNMNLSDSELRTLFDWRKSLSLHSVLFFAFLPLFFSFVVWRSLGKLQIGWTEDLSSALKEKIIERIASASSGELSDPRQISQLLNGFRGMEYGAGNESNKMEEARLEGIMFSYGGNKDRIDERNVSRSRVLFFI